MLSAQLFENELNALLSSLRETDGAFDQSGDTYRTTRFLIAYSGGLDSHVLLHLMATIRDRLNFKVRAVHVHHGLQAAADPWPVHCKKTAQALGISCDVKTLKQFPKKGESIEAVARKGRYAIFQDLLDKGEILLSAHHQQDQAETLLLQLFRGSGVKGLSGMANLSRFGRGYLVRPLLSFSQEALQCYARDNQLDYIEDPSNNDERFDRNFLRHHLFPQLRSRWPGMDRSLSRAASIQAETQHLLDEVAVDVLTNMADATAERLPVTSLSALSMPKRRLVLRYWIRSSGFQLPSEKKLRHIIDNAIFAKQDSMPLVKWGSVEIRRYQDFLYLMSTLVPHDNTQVIQWDTSRPLVLEGLEIKLEPEILGDLLHATDDPVTVRFRCGGERLYLPQKGHHVALKKLFQEMCIPPWMRSRIPLIYSGERLIHVHGLGRVQQEK